MNDCTTGAGSASPVVSMTMWSSPRPRCKSLLTARARSPRTVPADATVVELKNFLLGADHELAVDAGFAKLIDDNRDLLPSCTDRI
jgi:hypothetical protein